MHLFSLKRWKFNLTALAIVAVIATVYWFTMWSEPSNKDYKAVVDTLNGEVSEYKLHHDNSLPVSAMNASLQDPEGTYFIIDICDLMNYVPDGFATVDGEGNDNCDAGTCECSANASYVWLLDSYGDVFSRCVGDGCDSSSSDGYQGVWP